MLSPRKDLQSQCCKVKSCPGMKRRQRILLTFDEKTTEETNSVGTYIGDASRDKNQDGKSMVVSGSPKRWDRWHIIPQLAVYTTYSPCLLGGEKCYRSHLLGEPFQQPLRSGKVQSFKSWNPGGDCIAHRPHIPLGIRVDFPRIRRVCNGCASF